MRSTVRIPGRLAAIAAMAGLVIGLALLYVRSVRPLPAGRAEGLRSKLQNSPPTPRPVGPLKFGAELVFFGLITLAGRKILRLRLNSAAIALVAGILMFSPSGARAQGQAEQADRNTEAEKEPLGILELGAAPGWSLNGGGFTLSPTVAFEFTPIENLLEIEIGTTPTFAHHATEWDTDFLFKKPWDLSEKFEFMLGVGPVWIHKRAAGVTANAVGAEVAGDLMFWPTRKHRFGLYIEPAFQHNFGAGHENSIGFSGGLLIAIRR